VLSSVGPSLILVRSIQSVPISHAAPVSLVRRRPGGPPPRLCAPRPHPIRRPPRRPGAPSPSSTRRSSAPSMFPSEEEATSRSGAARSCRGHRPVDRQDRGDRSNRAPKFQRPPNPCSRIKIFIDLLMWLSQAGHDRLAASIPISSSRVVSLPMRTFCSQLICPTVPPLIASFSRSCSPHSSRRQRPARRAFDP
jgi:hypothetical protein